MEDHGTHAFPEGMREQLAKTEDFDVIADVFHQLGDPKLGSHLLDSVSL